MNKKGRLGNIIGLFIILLVGITLSPIVDDELTKSIQYSNGNETQVDSASEILVGLVGIFFILAVCIAAIGIVSSAFRSTGYLDEDETFNVEGCTDCLFATKDGKCKFDDEITSQLEEGECCKYKRIISKDNEEENTNEDQEYNYGFNDDDYGWEDKKVEPKNQDRVIHKKW